MMQDIVATKIIWANQAMEVAVTGTMQEIKSMLVMEPSIVIGVTIIIWVTQAIKVTKVIEATQVIRATEVIVSFQDISFAKFRNSMQVIMCMRFIEIILDI